MTAAARCYRWRDIPKEQLGPLLGRQYISAERVMLAHLHLARGCVVPRHAHENEQVTYVLDGALRFELGEPVHEVVVVRAGEVLHIPSGVPHAIEALEDTLDLDVFSPPRRDWIERLDGYLRAPSEPWMAPDVIDFTEKLLASHQRWTGRELVAAPDPAARARALYEAPFFVLAQGDEAEPCYRYGNRRALELFELDWQGLLRMPGATSAASDGRAEREQALARARRAGHITGYGGVRLSSTGRRFQIRDALLWSVIDEQGRSHGMSAACADWSFLP